MTGESPNASLAAMAPIIEAKGIFSAIHQQVVVPQKSIDYRPSDKLVLVILSMLSGNQTISDVNWTLRVDKPLLMAFGYTKCPDQSVLQDTLNAAIEENVEQLRGVASSLFAQHNIFQRQFMGCSEPKQLTLDFLSVCSTIIETRTKGCQRVFLQSQKPLWASIGTGVCCRDARSGHRPALFGQHRFLYGLQRISLGDGESVESQ